MRTLIAILGLVLVLDARAWGSEKVSQAMPAAEPGKLKAILAREAAAAKARGLRSYVELTAEWCRPCVAISKYLDDPAMVQAFTGVHLIRLDIDTWPSKDLEAVGLRATGVPFFFELDPRGVPTGKKMSSAAWGDDVPANMAPALSAFFTGRPIPPRR